MEGAAEHSRSSMHSAASVYTQLPVTAANLNHNANAAALQNGKADATDSEAKQVKTPSTASGWDTHRNDVQAKADHFLQGMLLS